MYVAVKGGEKAIDASHRLISEERRGDPTVPVLTLAQIQNQMSLAVERVMTEGSVYDPELAALALKQAQGDTVEAIFLLRAFRTTLPRFCYSAPLQTGKISLRRRVSAIFKDLPGGQVLGPTYDYTHRLLDFSLADDQSPAQTADIAPEPLDEGMTSVVDLLHAEDVVEHEDVAADDSIVFDLTREPASYPATRDARLQNLARSDEGFLLGLAYSTARGYGGAHPFVAEIRFGDVAVEVVPEELGFAIDIGDITVTECQMINQFRGSANSAPQFTRGYGLVFGHCERKTMAMALVDRALRARELGEPALYPAQDDEFVMSHSDSVEAVGFVSHFKLPHYVDFQAELQLLRRLRADYVAPALKEAAE
jgi:alpha-D-ribose 1-methylphosphonate 5-triphosphate synthase subunit PhnI